MFKKLFFFVVFLLPMTLSLPDDSGTIIDFEYPEAPTNYSTVSVNNSQYLQGYTPTTLWDYYTGLGNSLWCKLTGCNITGDLNVAGNVGIGTTSPDYKLQIGDDETSIESAFKIFMDEGTDVIDFYDNPNSCSAFKINVDDKFILFNEDNSGYAVGIGTTSPEYSLDVNGDLRVGEGNVGYIIFGDDAYGGEVGFLTELDEVLAVRMDTGNFEYGGGNPGSANLVVNGDSGKVGIGTTSPSEVLEVVGTGSTKIKLESSTNDASLYLKGLTGYASPNRIISNNDLRFDIGSLNPMFINATSGNVGIGTTTPTAKLEVNGSIKLNGNITNPTDDEWGYFNNGTCIVIGNLSYISEC